MLFQISIIALTILVIISLNVNFYLLFKLKQATKSPQLSIDAQHLLHEITGGQAILKINVIDPGDILLKSPRG